MPVIVLVPFAISAAPVAMTVEFHSTDVTAQASTVLDLQALPNATVTAVGPYRCALILRVARLRVTSLSSAALPGHEFEKLRTVVAAATVELANSSRNSTTMLRTSSTELCSRTTIDLLRKCGPSRTVTSIVQVEGNVPSGGAVQSTTGPVPTKL